MAENLTLPPFGSPEFWELYDRFCSKEEVTRLLGSKGHGTQLSIKLQHILREGHELIARLPRPEKKWSHPSAWLALRYEPIYDKNSYQIFAVQAGDVMTREFGWDRDVFVTQAPVTEHVCGFFLNQNWPMSEKGLFLPLYTKPTIMLAIQLRLEHNMKESLEKAEKESDDWTWPLA